MALRCKTQAPNKSKFYERGVDVRKGVVTWSDFEDAKPPTTLTEREIRCLKAKHAPYEPDYTRAIMVKEKMQEGETFTRIAALLAPLGFGYQRRTITKDHAALSEAVGEGLNKRSKFRVATNTKNIKR